MASIDYQEARKEIVRLFQENEGNGRKIIFWYDPPVNFKDDITADSFDCCKVLVCDKNEFAVKKTLEHDDPNSDYLIYSPSARPSDRENYLLDVELYSELFSADRASLVMDDLRVQDFLLKEAFEKYGRFFDSKDRKNAFRALGQELKTVEDVERGLLAVLTKTKAVDAEEIVRALAEMLTEKSR